MLFMLLLILGIYENIINEHYYKLVEVVMNTLFIKYMKNAGTFFRPNDMIVNS
jgi:hypothetical protein